MLALEKPSFLMINGYLDPKQRNKFMHTNFEDPATLTHFLDWLRVEYARTTSTADQEFPELARRFAEAYRPESQGTALRERTAGALVEWLNQSVKPLESNRWIRQVDVFLQEIHYPLPMELREPKAFIEFLVQERPNCCFIYEEDDPAFLKLLQEQEKYCHKRSKALVNVLRFDGFILRNTGGELRDSLRSEAGFTHLPAMALWVASDRVHFISLRDINQKQMRDLFDRLISLLDQNMALEDAVRELDQDAEGFRKEHRESKIRRGSAANMVTNNFNVSGTGHNIINGDNN